MVKEDLSLFYRKIDDILPEKTTLNIAFIHVQGTSTYKEFSDDYKKLNDFEKAFPNGIPDILNLKSLEVNNFRVFTEDNLEGDIKLL